jgi:hypothetical protein
MHKLTEQRRTAEEIVLQRMMKEDTAISNKQSVQEIYEILRKNDSNNNPMAGMLQRNLRLFEKMNIL